jgi:hypothetical protein
MIPTWNQQRGGATLSLDFINNDNVLDSRITFTRASSASYYDSTGTLQTAAINAPRFDYNPSTLAARGLLIEEARTNSVRNSSAVGGSAGVAPTNWSASGTSGSGVTATVSAVGTENGIPYVDLAITGTATATGTAFSFSFETASGAAASASTAYAQSFFLKLVNGSQSDTTLNSRIRWNNVSGSVITTVDSPAITPTTAALSSQRVSFSGTSPLLTAYIQPQLRIAVVNGTTYNFTLRVAYPQAELGAFATSVIPTTTVAATRSQDVATMTGTNFSSWYNQSQGTFVTQFVLEGVKSVAGQRVITTDDGSTTNQMLESGSSTNTFQTTVTTGGVTQVSQTVPSFTLAGFTTYKSALGYADNNTNTAINGLLATNDTSCTMPTALTTFRFAASTTTVTANVWYASLKFYPIRLPDGTLQGLTT